MKKIDWTDTTDVIVKVEKILDRSLWTSLVVAVVMGGIAGTIPESVPFVIGIIFIFISYNNARFTGAQYYINNLRALNDKKYEEMVALKKEIKDLDFQLNSYKIYFNRKFDDSENKIK